MNTEVCINGRKIAEVESKPKIGDTRQLTMICPSCFGKKKGRSVYTENGWITSSYHQCSHENFRDRSPG
jgi:hypothetical protein